MGLQILLWSAQPLNSVCTYKREQYVCFPSDTHVFDKAPYLKTKFSIHWLFMLLFSTFMLTQTRSRGHDIDYFIRCSLVTFL